MFQNAVIFWIKKILKFGCKIHTILFDVTDQQISTKPCLFTFMRINKTWKRFVAHPRTQKVKVERIGRLKPKTLCGYKTNI
jgi:diphthamide biosynthesis methyltransferase